ncbi:MAG TPA: PP2C family protein-serine/threonine phosphatase [Mycobacteriales bacterium]
MQPDPTAVLGELVRRAREAGPGRLASLVADAAAAVGLADAVIYLADYSQTRLMPVPYPGMPARLPLGVDGTLAGRAYRTGSPLDADGTDEATRRLWLPLSEGHERLGVLETTLAAAGAAGAETAYAALFADVVAMLVATQWRYGDVFELVRRVRPMRLPAEIQWRLLPPTTVRATGVSLSGLLEPWDEVGGDAFDYALNDGRLHVALLDAMGHGLGATLLSSLAIGAYRNARRGRADLVDSYEAIDVALATQFGRTAFATGLLLDLDVATGAVRWLTAGHLPPLLIRHERAVTLPPARPATPFGLRFSDGHPPVHTLQLEPGDRLALYTDGVVEARRLGQFFTEERLADFVVRESASGLDGAEVLRRLIRAVLEHQHGVLQDDATILLLEWDGPPA